MTRRLTLFVEETSVRLLAINGKRVEKWDEILLPSGLVSSGVVSDETKLAELIRERLKTLNIVARKVTMGLSSPNSIYRIISLPDVPPSLVLEGIRVEAEKAVPVPLSEVYLSHQPLPNGDSDDKRYFLAAYDKKATDSLIRTVTKAGPRPYLLDLAPLCLCRSVKAPQAIVASLRGSFFDGVVMADRVPQVIRSLELPVKDELFEGKLSAVAEEIQRVIAFYNSSGPVKPLDSTVPIFVSGDLAKSPDISSVLSGRLGYTVSVQPSLLDAPEDFPAHNYAINIGLALKESQREDGQSASLINFNALPEIYQPKGVSIISILTPVVLSVFLTASSYTGYLAWNTDKYAKALAGEVSAEQNLIKARQSEVAALTNKIKKIQDEIKPVKATQTAVEAEVTSLRDNRTRFSINSNFIVSVKPETVTAITIGYGEKGTSVTGSAPTDDDVFSYAKAIRWTGRFASVTISSVAAKADGTGFDFKFTLQPK